MKARRLAMAVGLAALVAGCGSGLTVNTDYDPEVDFSAYQTFAVLDAAGEGVALNQLETRRVKTAIAAAMEAKGLSRVDNPNSADVSVGWQITTEQRSSFQTVNTGWGSYGRYGYGGWYGGGVGMTSSRTTETRYDVGTMVIAMFDERADQMVFTATGSKTLNTANMSPDEAQQRANEIVAEILRDFPPGG